MLGVQWRFFEFEGFDESLFVVEAVDSFEFLFLVTFADDTENEL
jgi:hypothetical protein